MQLSRKADPGLLPLILLIVILPVIEESHQLLIPGRSFSIFDIFADIAGAFSAFITYKINEKKIRSRFNSL